VPAPVDLISAFVGFGLVVVAGARLGAGSPLGLTGLFPAQGRSDWPHGVQEGDVPRFALDHVAALRPEPPADVPWIHELAHDEPAAPMVEIIEWRVRSLARQR
jgi:hypothetical protein